MTRIYIFEGVDGSGKTTAAKTTAQMLGYPYVHFDAKAVVQDYVSGECGEALAGDIPGLVMDRSWYSEMPYNRAYHKREDRVGKNFPVLERIFATQFTSVIFCDPGWDAVRGSWNYDHMQKGKEEMLKGIDQLKEVYGWYQDQLKYTKLPVTRYNYLTDSLLSVVGVAEMTGGVLDFKEFLL